MIVIPRLPKKMTENQTWSKVLSEFAPCEMIGRALSFYQRPPYEDPISHKELGRAHAREIGLEVYGDCYVKISDLKAMTNKGRTDAYFYVRDELRKISNLDHQK